MEWPSCSPSSPSRAGRQLAEQLPRRPGGKQIIPRPDRWEPGPPSPWRDRTGVDRPLSTAEVLHLLRPHLEPRPSLAPAGARPAAVLIALFDGPAGAEVVLTRRGWHLSTHQGEVSFPGGRVDPGETSVEAALREAWEEVCLPPAQVEIHGELDHLSTIRGASYIVPIVGRLAARPDLRPGTSEVERILYVPLAELTRIDTHREERWGWGEESWPIQFFELDDETIWGATARILAQLLTLVHLS